MCRAAFPAFVLAVALLGSATGARAAETLGFIPKSIWYSTERPVGGETVKVYAAVFNGGKDQLVGTAVFYDGKTVLGRREVSVLGKSLKDVSVDWRPAPGVHHIRVVLEGAGTRGLDGVVTPLPGSMESTDTVTVADPQAVEAKKNLTLPSAELAAVGERIEEYVPEPVASAFGKAEAFREDVAGRMAERRTEAKADWEEKKAGSASVKGASEQVAPAPMVRPLAALKYYAFSAFAFVSA